MYLGNTWQGRFCAWQETFTLPFLPPQPGTLRISTTNRSFPLGVRCQTVALGFVVDGETIQKRSRAMGWGLRMVRPERFELPTFWFVARRPKSYLVDLISLTSFQGAFNWTPGSNFVK